MQQRTWEIDAIHWNSAGSRPTHITIEVRDRDLMPALREFAAQEGLKLIAAELPRPDEYWMGYSREDFEQAQMSPDQHMTSAYWELERRRQLDPFNIGDRVRLIDTLMARPGDSFMFTQIGDDGVITERDGEGLYTVLFHGTQSIPEIPARNLELVEAVLDEDNR